MSVITSVIVQRVNDAQNWQMGAVLTVVVIAVTTAVVLPVLARPDFNGLTGK